MAKKIHKLSQGGKTVYPATISDAVVHPGTRTSINSLFNEINVSVVFPTSGTDGTNRYTLEGAVAQVPAELRNVGLKVSFVDSAGQVETWEYQGGTFTNTGSWVQQVQRTDISELELKNKENDARINTVDGVDKSVAISANQQGTNTILMPMFKGQKIRITINAPAESRLLGIELSNEKSTSGTDKQRLFWGTLNSEKIFEVEAGKDYSYLLIELWTTDILDGTFEYINSQKYALQEEYRKTEEISFENYQNMKHAISQYSFAGKAQDYPEDFNFDIMNFGRAWVGGGHKLSTQNKSIYGASVYIEFNSDDIYESSDANEVCVFLTDTTPAQGAFIDSLNIIFTTTFNAPQKGIRKSIYACFSPRENILSHTKNLRHFADTKRRRFFSESLQHYLAGKSNCSSFNAPHSSSWATYWMKCAVCLWASRASWLAHVSQIMNTSARVPLSNTSYETQPSSFCEAATKAKAASRASS